MDDVGIFRTTIEVEAFTNSGNRVTVSDVMVDTGSEYTWIPEHLLHGIGVQETEVEQFETADGRILERPIGNALLHAGGRGGASVIVFARPGDMVLLGAHGLEALRLRVDLVRRQLVPAGPAPAAAAA